MPSIIDNSNQLIKDIYEKCIVDGEIHIFRNTKSLKGILEFSKNIINNHFKSGALKILTTPGFSLYDIYSIYKLKDKTEKFKYIMENFKEISNNIIFGNIPLLDC